MTGFTDAEFEIVRGPDPRWRKGRPIAWRRSIRQAIIALTWVALAVFVAAIYLGPQRRFEPAKLSLPAHTLAYLRTQQAVRADAARGEHRLPPGAAHQPVGD